MAKSTVGGGPSFSDAELVDPDPPVVMKKHPPTVARFQVGTLSEVGGESSSVGSSSEPSSTEDPNSNELPTQIPLEHAHTTESPSGRSEKGQASGARSTGGNGPEMEKESTEEFPPYEEWLLADLQDECRNRGLTVSGRKDDLVARLEQYDGEYDIAISDE